MAHLTGAAVSERYPLSAPFTNVYLPLSYSGNPGESGVSYRGATGKRSLGVTIGLYARPSTSARERNRETTAAILLGGGLFWDCHAATLSLWYVYYPGIGCLAMNSLIG